MTLAYFSNKSPGDKQLTHVGNLVDWRVCAKAEVCAGNVVADCRWNDGHWNTELGVFVSQLSHHQYTVIRLHMYDG